MNDDDDERERHEGQRARKRGGRRAHRTKGDGQNDESEDARDQGSARERQVERDRCGWSQQGTDHPAPAWAVRRVPEPEDDGRRREYPGRVRVPDR